jgi:transposase
VRTLHAVAKIAALPETDRLHKALEAWWSQIEALIVTGVADARTEAANTTIKNIKRTAAGSATRTATALVSCSPAP